MVDSDAGQLCCDWLIHTDTFIAIGYSDAGQQCGAVRHMKWTPDGCALALTWEKGGFSLWSVFGALILHSMGPDME